mgnify:CR=1 FL=1|jgi:hypothetical protein|tara:strand:+ start:2902 stop:3897 length:996 start_codon:yes stop_codon:yes gene_type:complete
MKTQSIKIVSILVVSLFLTIFLPVHAQIPGLGNTIDVTAFPNFPGPNQEVSMRVQSFSIDLNRSEVAWFVNSSLIARGIGQTEASFITGELGSQSSIEVIVQTRSGALFTKQFTIRPTEVDLVWEGETYTPPLYSGKALPAADAEIVVAAFPTFITQNKNTVDPSTLIYTWKQDGKVLGRLSGFGKQSVRVSGPKFFQSTTVSVEVETQSGALTGRGVTQIDAVEPTIFFYESHPLLGIRYERAFINQVTFTNEEISLVASPYFISAKNLDDSALKYEWRINNRETVLDGVPGKITLERPEEVSGTASIQLSIQHLEKLLQSAARRLIIRF